MTTDPRMAGLTPEVAAMVSAGARALREGKIQLAERALQQASAGAPTHSEPLRYLAIAQRYARHFADAHTSLQRALALAPDDAMLHSDLGTLQAARGDLDAALACWRRACVLDPCLATAWFNLGRNLQQLGSTDAAIDALEHTLALAPDIIPAHVLLGDALTHRGRFDAASAHYRDALRLRPDCGDAWRGLGNIKTVALGQSDADALHAQLQRHDLDPTDRIAMGHALGKLEEDRGQFQAAFAALQQANALQQQLTPWSESAFTRYLEQALQHTQTLPAPLDANLGHEVIFIAGMPRSGSTLFEHILAAHPDVEGASELPDLGIVIQQESARRGVAYPLWVSQATPADWHRLGCEYLRRTERWRQQHPRHTDKQPDNWKHAGILRAMLPAAIMIEPQRDPLETAWSCFKQQFYSQPHFANTLANCAVYLRGCEQAMDVWRGQHPTQLHRFQYDALLVNPEPSIRALLGACGLRFDPACLAFHLTTRSVRTASAAQVRQPLQPPSARATAYGSLLNPLRTALAQPPPPSLG